MSRGAPRDRSRLCRELSPDGEVRCQAGRGHATDHYAMNRDYIKVAQWPRTDRAALADAIVAWVNELDELLRDAPEFNGPFTTAADKLYWIGRQLRASEAQPAPQSLEVHGEEAGT